MHLCRVSAHVARFAVRILWTAGIFDVNPSDDGEKNDHERKDTERRRIDRKRAPRGGLPDGAGRPARRAVSGVVRPGPLRCAAFPGRADSAVSASAA